MLSHDAERMQASLVRIERASAKIGIGFKAIFVIAVVTATVFFFSRLVEAFVLSINSPGEHTLDLGFLAALLSVSIACTVLFVIAKIFDDISKYGSPFTSSQAKRISLVGWLLIIGTALEAFMSVFHPINFSIVGLNLSYIVSPQDNEGLFINGTYLIGAILCFSLSVAFKYGALLQRLSDDTI